jgi:septal ring factor EnvC (AmiA/AmiB activator)
MTDEQMQKTIEFILEQQAQFAADVGQIQENIKHLTTAQTNLAVAQSRTEATVDRLAAQVERTEATVGRLAAQVERTEATVGRLATQVERTEATVGRLATQVEINALQQAHINEVIAVIADSQQRTDERLNKLIDIVEEGRNGAA